MAGEHDDHEDFQRVSLDARGVDERLVDEGIDELCGQHDGEDNQGEDPDVHAQSDAGTVFEDDAEHDSDDLAQQRTYIRDDVQQSGDEGDTESVVEIDSGDEPESEQVEQHDPEDLNDYSDEIAGEQFFNVEDGFLHPRFDAVGNQRPNDAAEELVVLDEEDGDEDDGKDSHGEAGYGGGHRSENTRDVRHINHFGEFVHQQRNTVEVFTHPRESPDNPVVDLVDDAVTVHGFFGFHRGGIPYDVRDHRNDLPD